MGSATGPKKNVWNLSWLESWGLERESIEIFTQNEGDLKSWEWQISAQSNSKICRTIEITKSYRATVATTNAQPTCDPANNTLEMRLKKKYKSPKENGGKGEKNCVEEHLLVLIPDPLDYEHNVFPLRYNASILVCGYPRVIIVPTKKGFAESSPA